MSDAWEHFSGKVDDLGWTDTTNVEAFNYAVHHTMQSLRALLRGGLSNPSDVPSGWVVVNPRRMAELKEAERAVTRARELADEWAAEPYAEEFTSILAGVLIDTLDGSDDAS